MIAILLACGGIFVAGVLSASHFFKVDVPCGAGEGCTAVANHASSSFVGVPVAYFGLFGYVALVAISAFRAFSLGQRYRMLVKAGFALSVVGTIASIILQYIAFAEIKARCSWCLSSAILMAALFLVHAALLQTSSPVVQGASDVPDSPKIEKISTRGFDLGFIFAVVLATLAITGYKIDETRKGMPRQVITSAKVGPDAIAKLTLSAHSMGDQNAPITVVEFADLYCPACRTSYNHMRGLVNEHSGKIRWIFRHFPLWHKQGHENAMEAAIMSEVAANGNRFFEFLQAMFENDPANIATETQLYDILASLNIDSESARRAIEQKDSPEFLRVVGDIELADQIGISLTPTFLVILKGEDPVAVDRNGLDAMLSEPKYREILKK
jgi:protein-disulfide isomerase